MNETRHERAIDDGAAKALIESPERQSLMRLLISNLSLLGAIPVDRPLAQSLECDADDGECLRQDLSLGCEQPDSFAEKCLASVLRIRHGESADARAVAEIQVRSRHEAYRDFMPCDRLAAMTIDVRAPIWEKLLADGVTFVAEARDRIAEFCSVRPVRNSDLDSSRFGKVYALYVMPDSWRRGVGQDLCAAGLTWLREQGFEATSLWVLEANRIGRAFYEKLGFTPDGKTASYHASGQVLPELRYMISLQLAVPGFLVRRF